MQHEYDPSSFVQPLTFEDYYASLTEDQYHTLNEFYAAAAQGSSHYKTANNIFVTLQQPLETEPSIPDCTVTTCRRIGHTMLRETCAVQEVRYLPFYIAGHHALEKIIHLQGHETNRLATLTLGRSALWIEQDDEGYAAHYPLLPFQPHKLPQLRE